MLNALKVAMYALVGFAIYELVIGLTGNRLKSRHRPSPTAIPPTPPVQGKRVAVGDQEGAEHMQVVGRGVVSR
jgi:hypothetical protein